MAAPPSKANNEEKEYVPASVLQRFDEDEGVIKDIRRRVKLFQDTSSLIVIVLFVFTIALGFTVIFFFIQAINDDAGSRRELTESVQELKTEIKLRNQASGLGTDF